MKWLPRDHDYRRLLDILVWERIVQIISMCPLECATCDPWFGVGILSTANVERLELIGVDSVLQRISFETNAEEARPCHV